MFQSFEQSSMVSHFTLLEVIHGKLFGNYWIEEIEAAGDQDS